MAGASDISDEIAEAERRIAAAEQRLADGREKRQAADRGLRLELEADREAVATRFAALETRVDEHAAASHDELATARTEAAAELEEARTTAAREIAALYRRLEAMRREIEAVDARIPDLSPDTIERVRLGQAEVRVIAAELQGSIEAVDGRLDELESRLRDRAGRGAVDAVTADLARRITALEALAPDPPAANVARTLSTLVSPTFVAPPTDDLPPPVEVPGREAAIVVRPWLPDALRRLAVTDPAAAERLILALLRIAPAPGPLRAGIAYAGRDRWSLSVAAGAAHVTPAEDGAGRPAFTIKGDGAAFGDLLAGRRGTGARLQGRLAVRHPRRARWYLRRVGQAARRPADLDVALDPAALAAGLAALVDPAWTEETERVAVRLQVGDHAQFTVIAGRDDVAKHGRAAQVAAGRAAHVTAAGVPADAVASCSDAAFAAWLSGDPVAEPALVRGDVAALRTLAALGERALRG